MKRSYQIPAGCTYVAERDQLTCSQYELADSLAFEHGEAYDSYLLLNDNRQYFFSPHGRGVVGFSSWGRHLFVVGGLLTSPEEKPQLLRYFLEFASRNRFNPRFFNVLRTDRELFREHGFHVSKIGEEPILDLRTTNWRGRKYEWVRRQENSCRRAGLECRELDLTSMDQQERAAIVRRLHQISDDHVSATVFGREMSLMVGKVDFEQQRRERVFVAECDGTAAAFVIANPVYGGDMWTIETYRKSPEAERGVIPFLIMQVARQLQSEGIPFLSLCQVPSLRSAEKQDADSPLVHRSMRLWWNHVSFLYDPRRQFHFKSRFRPDYRECFVATLPGHQLVPLAAFGIQWGVVWPDFKRLPIQMMRRMRKWSHKERLADPATEEYALIKDLRREIDDYRRRFAPQQQVAAHSDSRVLTNAQQYESVPRTSGEQLVSAS